MGSVTYLHGKHESDLSDAAMKRAANARAAIEGQEGPREHVHRGLRKEDIDSIPYEELPSVRARLREALADRVEEHKDVCKRLMVRLPSDEYVRLRRKRADIGQEILDINGLLGSMNERIKRGMPENDKYPSRFIDAAKVMLPPSVYDAIAAAAARKAWHEQYREEKA